MYFWFRVLPIRARLAARDEESGVSARTHVFTQSQLRMCFRKITKIRLMVRYSLLGFANSIFLYLGDHARAHDKVKGIVSHKFLSFFNRLSLD